MSGWRVRKQLDTPSYLQFSQACLNRLFNSARLPEECCLSGSAFICARKYVLIIAKFVSLPLIASR